MENMYSDFGYNVVDGFDSFQIIFFIIFAFIAIVIFFSIFGNINEKAKNSSLPILTVDANVLTKRMEIMGHNRSYTEYYITFEVESGDRIELRTPAKEYGIIVEGDRGHLTFQGTKYKNFEREKQ